MSLIYRYLREFKMNLFILIIMSILCWSEVETGISCVFLIFLLTKVCIRELLDRQDSMVCKSVDETLSQDEISLVEMDILN